MRWQLAQMLPRLTLTPAETRRVVARILEYLNDDSRIVKTFAMQALADFAERDHALRLRALPLLDDLTRQAAPPCAAADGDWSPASWIWMNSHRSGIVACVLEGTRRRQCRTL